MIRDEVRFERIEDERPEPRDRCRERVTVDVSDVSFGGVQTSTAQKLQRRLAEAAIAFENERFSQAEDLLASIERLAPGVPEVLELRGLTNYRLGRWGRTIGYLETFYELTGSADQHPVLADCNRALKRWQRVEELWQELRDASPSAEIVEEGRLVYAGGLADRGRLVDAIQLLERAPRPGKRPGVHHLRRWYLLADLYERSGDLARARRVFGDIVASDARFGDAAERLAALG